MYTAARILAHISSKTVSLRNIHEGQMQSFLRFQEIRTEADTKVLIDGGIGQKRMILPQEEEVLVYLSLDQDLCWNPLSDKEKMVYVRGTIKKQSRSLLHNDHFHVFVYCRDEQKREKILQLKERKELVYSKGELYIQAEAMTEELFKRFTKEWSVSERSQAVAASQISAIQANDGSEVDVVSRSEMLE